MKAAIYPWRLPIQSGAGNTRTCVFDCATANHHSDLVSSRAAAKNIATGIVRSGRRLARVDYRFPGRENPRVRVFFTRELRPTVGCALILIHAHAGQMSGLALHTRERKETRNEPESPFTVRSMHRRGDPGVECSDDARL